MRGLRTVLGIAALAALLAVFATVAFATEEGGHAVNWKDLAFRVINVLVVLFILYKAAAKRLIAYFVGRRKGIVDDLSGHEARREAAQQSLADVEQHIANLEAERTAILDEYRAQGEMLKAEIIARAERAAAQIAEQARRSAENEAMLAVEAIRAQVAGEIVEEAERILRERLSDAEHLRLIDASLKRVVLH